MRWDVFCRVVDNYGDAGVCFRLARLLAAEHALDVTLWQDDVATLSRIVAGVDPRAPTQRVAGVTIRPLVEPFPDAEPADVVVEAFGCGLPGAYVDAMAKKALAPAWFILEYLSAEPWVERSHGLASPHPRTGIARRFWFPGFTARTGGLLRERGLIATRNALLGDARAQHEWWSVHGLPPIAADELRVSMFCYPDAPLAPLFDVWAGNDTSTTCVVPEGVAADAIAAWSGGDIPRPAAPVVRGRLTLHAVALLTQDDYDRLLWLSSLNFVRGEDSFVRGQWASRPLVWHIYAQEDAAHWAKLDAFIDRYGEGVAPESAEALRRFWRAWNGEPAVSVARAWLDFAAARPHLDEHARAWTQTLTALPELAQGLVKAAHREV
jgi:uncharacterized repeat protein (TIGR03837 family)